METATQTKGEENVIVYTKPELITRLNEIQASGWIENNRKGNDGSPGNVLEDILGIEENNLPIPNSGEWELKTKRTGSSSLLTLMHTNPSPTGMSLLQKQLVVNYGWRHKEAGTKYPQTEKSFRQTLNANTRTDRGFKITVDRESKKIITSFDHTTVGARHSSWLKDVERNIGLGELSPQPYWGFDDVYAKARTKWTNCFFVLVETKTMRGVEYIRYTDIWMLQTFTQERFLAAIESGVLLFDYDARTGHDHGVKIRLRSKKDLSVAFRMLFEVAEKIA